MAEEKQGWIGVDLDGTLAHYDGWKGPEHIGEPIPKMMERVKAWIAEGREVKIFTARACVHEQLPPINDWLIKHGLLNPNDFDLPLEITNVKDFQMVELWDDRCVQVVPNTGVTIAIQVATDLKHKVGLLMGKEEHDNRHL